MATHAEPVQPAEWHSHGDGPLHNHPGGLAGPHTHDAPTPKRKRRVFLWVFLALQVLFLVWAIGAGLSGGSVHSATVAYCHAHPSQYLSYQECLNTYSGGAKAGTAIGTALIVVGWFVVDVILGVTYLIYRLAKR